MVSFDFQNIEQVRWLILNSQPSKSELLNSLNLVEMTTENIIRADKRYRKRILTIYLISVLMGIVLIGWGFPLAKNYTELLQLKTALRMFEIIFSLLCLSIAAAGLYGCAIGRRILESGQLPPPGMKVIADTRLIWGKEAKIWGRLMVVISMLVVFLALFGAFHLPLKIREAFPDRIEQTNLIDHCSLRGEPSRSEGSMNLAWDEIWPLPEGVE
jgi:hypothetical protein